MIPTIEPEDIHVLRARVEKLEKDRDRAIKVGADAIAAATVAMHQDAGRLALAVEFIRWCEGRSLDLNDGILYDRAKQALGKLGAAPLPARPQGPPNEEVSRDGRTRERKPGLTVRFTDRLGNSNPTVEEES